MNLVYCVCAYFSAVECSIADFNNLNLEQAKWTSGITFLHTVETLNTYSTLCFSSHNRIDMIAKFLLSASTA